MKDSMTEVIDQITAGKVVFVGLVLDVGPHPAHRDLVAHEMYRYVEQINGATGRDVTIGYFESETNVPDGMRVTMMLPGAKRTGGEPGDGRIIHAS
jgi:hypothetical protein